MDAVTVLEMAGSAAGGAAVTLAAIYRFFVPRETCVLRHRDDEKSEAEIKAAIEDRRQAIHDLRDTVAPLVTRVALVENTLGHVTAVVESIAEKVGANGFEPRTRRK